LATVDCNGRLAETAVVRALGWSRSLHLDVRECGPVLVTASVFGGEADAPACSEVACIPEPFVRLLVPRVSRLCGGCGAGQRVVTQ
jgi:hypothetical protein